MPFDLPAGAPSPLNIAAWAAAVNARDFQDKQLRIVQYAGRALSHHFLQLDKKDPLGLKFQRLYQQVSISRKAFRSFRWVKDVHEALKFVLAAIRTPNDDVKWLKSVQSVMMAVHMFWDNVFFLTHSAVAVVGGPDVPWWNNSNAGKKLKDWRSMADLVGLVASLLGLVRARRACVKAAGESEVAKTKADANYKEAWYAVAKLIFDVFTYLPQTTFYQKTVATKWPEARIGAAGVAAALLACRSEWIKLKVS